MRTAEDTKTNPMPGDVLKYHGLTIEVQRYGHGQVLYRCADAGGWRSPTGSFIGQWRKWAATAEVIRVAQEPGK